MKFSAPLALLALLALSLPMAFASAVARGEEVKKWDDKKEIELKTFLVKEFELVVTKIDVKKGVDYGYHYDEHKDKDKDLKIFAFVLLDDDKKDDKKEYDHDYKKNEHKDYDYKQDDKKDEKHYRF